MSVRPLHVLHVAGGLRLGGAETLLYRMATRPDPTVRHEVICLADRDWYSDPLERQGVTVHHLGMVGPASFLRGIPSFVRLVRRLRPDVIQSWMYRSNFLAGVVGKTAGIPVIWGIHSSTLKHVSGSSRVFAYASGLGARWLTDHVVNCSARSAELHNRLGYNRARNSVVHNGYDDQAFAPDEGARKRTRATLGFEQRQFLIGTVSRWHAEKDIPMLFEALGLVRQRGLHPVALLIGRGLDEASLALAQSIRQWDVVDVVRPLGMRHDVADLARAMDLHVLPSRAEAFPNVVAETMLSGTPNAVTDVGDSAAMIGETGWLIPPARPDLLAQALEQAFNEWRDQPAKWEARRVAARDRIAKDFTVAAMHSSYERIWRAAVARLP